MRVRVRVRALALGLALALARVLVQAQVQVRSRLRERVRARHHLFERPKTQRGGVRQMQVALPLVANWALLLASRSTGSPTSS